MISALKTTLTLIISRFKGSELNKILQSCLRSFVNFDPGANPINLILVLRYVYVLVISMKVLYFPHYYTSLKKLENE